MQDSLKRTFDYYRSIGHNATRALSETRALLAAGKQKYGRRESLTFNPPHSSHGDRHVRWIEKAADGLRLVGYADEIRTSIRHQGWYTEDDGMNGETLRGVVYQLPSRNGKERFAYGYEDQNNEGAALLCFDPCDDKDDAALWADRFAEYHAEEQRDHNRAWQAGRQFEYLGEDVAKARKACLAIIREAKAGCATITDLPAIKAAIRDKIESLVDTIRDARKERAELLADYGNEPAFRDA